MNRNNMMYIKLTLKEKFLMLIYSLMFIVSFCSLFKGCGWNYSEPKKVDTIKVNQIKTDVLLSDKNYQSEMKRLKQHADSLDQNLKISQKELLIAVIKVKVTQNKWTNFIQRYDKDTLLKKDSFAFDSIVEIGNSLTKDFLLKDSICMNQLEMMNEIILLKDSLIEKSDNAYQDLKSGFNALSEIHDELIGEYSSLEKKFRRRQILHKFHVAATTLLSGICLTLFIKQ